MEKLCKCRDGSKSSQQKTLTGKGYLIEGSVAYYKDKLTPLLLSLYSYEDKNFLNDKQETKNNLLTLKVNSLCEQFIHIYRILTLFSATRR